MSPITNYLLSIHQPTLGVVKVKQARLSNRTDLTVINVLYEWMTFHLLQPVENTHNINSIVSKFANTTDTTINTDGRNKTVYTTNADNPQQASLLLQQKGSLIPIPLLKPDEYYRFLGIHLNLHLNWSVQHAYLLSTLT